MQDIGSKMRKAHRDTMQDIGISVRDKQCRTLAANCATAHREPMKDIGISFKQCRTMASNRNSRSVQSYADMTNLL
eukprot:14642496-Heterocapsa_arctica.AAC.1